MAQQLGNDTTSITADGAELVVERVFDAPIELVWTALTTPQHVSRWWGRTGTTTEVVELDVRAGGRWRFIAEGPAGGAPFTGEFTEVVPPIRLVRTLIFDVPPYNTMPAAIDTITLETVDGRTRLVNQARFPSPEALEGALAQGMTKGTIEQFDRLAELLAQRS